MTRSNKAFIKDFIAKGNDVVLASGRNTRMLNPIERAVGSNLAFIGCNGGYVRDKDGRNLVTHPLPVELVRDIYLEMKDKYGIYMWFMMDDSRKDYVVLDRAPRGLLVLGKIVNSLSLKYKEDYELGAKKFVARMNNGEPIYKLMPIFGIGGRGSQWASEALVPLREKFGDKVTLAQTSSSIEITAKGVSKGSGVSTYIKEKGIDPDQVIVVGDSGNDISMFDEFWHSFVMDKAPSAVKKHAVHVIRRVSDISQYLENPVLLANDRKLMASRNI